MSDGYTRCNFCGHEWPSNMAEGHACPKWPTPPAATDDARVVLSALLDKVDYTWAARNRRMT